MVATKKIQQVEELESYLKDNSIIIGTNYRGLDVQEMQGLRRALRASNASYKVVKNRLLSIAASNIEGNKITEIVDGPTGLVTSDAEPASVAKALNDYINENQLDIKILGALIDGAVIDAEQISVLAKLPSREVVLSQLLGDLNAPSQSLVSVLKSALTKLVNTIEQRRIQVEERNK
jgi:large subunit ribosomal protein L10